MDAYDPAIRPRPEEWLSLEESEQIDLVFEHHSSDAPSASNETMHATIHVIVENQIAAGVESVIDAESRLLRQGLDRHEAVHAIGAVLAEQLYNSVVTEAEFSEKRYRSRLKKLTAKNWKKGKW